MRVLFVTQHAGVGSLLPALKLLDERGHQVHLAYETVEAIEPGLELQALAEECPRMTFGELPRPDASGRAGLASWLRCSIDYLRYLEPRYRGAGKLRDRARRKAPGAMVPIGRVAGLAGPAGVAGLRRGLQLLERCLVPPEQVERYLAEQAPDVLLLGHLLPFGSSHADYLRAAKRLGVRSAFPVRGWDNLTNKGLLRDAPDLVLVWNDLQAAEAEELHRVPRKQIRLTGAPLCDDWFDWQPSKSREEFCADVGLRADRPVVLYVCSSGFVAARQEVDFVQRWLDALRGHGGMLSEAGVLVRPHPLNAAQWADADFGDPQVSVWPRFGEAPHDEASRRNYYDSIYHASAVVGINTTAQIESAIVGRPVHTVLAPEFAQESTLHFHYLRAEGFGLLVVGRTLAEHVEQLEQSVRGRPDDGRNERFLRRFVRPLGLDRPATEAVVQELEDLGARPAPAPDRGPALGPFVRALLAPAAALAGRSLARQREERTARSTPIDDLRRELRTRALHRIGLPVVAGPWLGDEVGELLYWIPFLRAAETLDPGLRARMFVLCRASSAAWYEGIGGGLVDVEQLVGREGVGRLAGDSCEPELQGSLRGQVADVFGLGSRAFRTLPAALVAAARADLAAQDPAAHVRQRLLAFAPLRPPGHPGDSAPAGESVALGDLPAGIDTALADWRSVVSVAGLDRPALTGALAGSRGFVGRWGVEALLAVLLGVPAVVLDAEADDDVRAAASFLARPPFGRLWTIDAGDGSAEAAERARRLLESSATPELERVR